MKPVALIALTLLAGCQQQPDEGAAQRMQALENRVAQLENAERERVQDRLANSEPAQVQAPATVQAAPPPSPRYELEILGTNSRPRSYPSSERCEAARQAVMEQQEQACRDSGAIACGSYRATCVPL